MSELVPTIKLIIKGKKIPERQFRIAIEAFFDLVSEIQESIAGKKSKIKWLVSVSSGSAEVHLTPELYSGLENYFPQITSALSDGIAGIKNPDFRPLHYSDKALESVRKLSGTIDPTSKEIEDVLISTNGKGVSLSPNVMFNIDALLQIKREEYGSIEGRLDLISSRKGYHFFITDLVRNHAIKCDFPESMKEKILDSFNKRVYVFGLIKYRKGNVPFSIELQYIKPIKEQSKLPTADDVYGILKGLN